MLSILSGKFKGHKLQCPKSGTRPTSSLVKKALFDTLRSRLEDTIFCDLFAGSGAIGFEALSQGSKQAYLIEPNKQAFMCIKSNAESLKCLDGASFFCKKAHKFLEAEPSLVQAVDIFFLDPPYDIPQEDASSYESLLKFFNDHPLKQDVLIICETKDADRIKKPLEDLEALKITAHKSYGDSQLFFIEKS